MENKQRSLSYDPARRLSIRNASSIADCERSGEVTRVYPDDGGQGQGAGGLPDYWRTLVRYRRAVLVASFGGALL